MIKSAERTEKQISFVTIGVAASKLNALRAALSLRCTTRVAFHQFNSKVMHWRERRSEERGARPRGMRRMRPMFGEAEFVRLEDLGRA